MKPKPKIEWDSIMFSVNEVANSYLEFVFKCQDLAHRIHLNPSHVIGKCLPKIAEQRESRDHILQWARESKEFIMKNLEAGEKEEAERHEMIQLTSRLNLSDKDLYLLARWAKIKGKQEDAE